MDNKGAKMTMHVDANGFYLRVKTADGREARVKVRTPRDREALQILHGR